MELWITLDPQGAEISRNGGPPGQQRKQQKEWTETVGDAQWLVGWPESPTLRHGFSK